MTKHKNNKIKVEKYQKVLKVTYFYQLKSTQVRKTLNAFRLLFHYTSFVLSAKYRKGHGVHSPFVYEFVRKVIFDKTPYPHYSLLDEIRKELRNSERVVNIHDIGASSNTFKQKIRKVSSMIKNSSIRPRYGKLLYRIAQYYKPGTIVELGTSIGYSTLFLAKGSPDSQVITLEGNPDLCVFARQLFNKNTAGNIKVAEGLFDEQLPCILKNYPKPELVFVDGNHAYEPVMKYFNKFCEEMDEGMILFDDIYWSAEMRRAWKEIELDPRATVTINLFFLGIVIRRNSITPGNYTIRF